MKNIKDFLKEWLPFIISIFFGIITIIIYVLMNDEASGVVVLEIVGGMMIPLVLPLVKLLFKLKFPNILNYFITIHVILAIDFGSALNFYELVPSWDLILHSYFGFIGSLFLYIELIKLSKEKNDCLGYMIVLFLCVMGLAGLWEVWEFTCDSLLGGDSQKVNESIALGFSPVHDTMIDMIITMVGIFVFDLIVIIDKLRGAKFRNSLYDFLIEE